METWTLTMTYNLIFLWINLPEQRFKENDSNRHQHSGHYSIYDHRKINMARPSHAPPKEMQNCAGKSSDDEFNFS